MTARGFALVLSAVLLAVLGWSLGWPELTILGAAALVPVVVALLGATGGARFDVGLDTHGIRVVRGEEASVRVTLQARGRRRRLCRLVEGPPDQPRRSFTLPALDSQGAGAIVVPVDTSRRGLHALGPFRVVRGDAWSVVRRELGATQQGSLLVRPRTHPVRPGFASVLRRGDSEAMTRTTGDDHFFALRDYAFGDEPRNVHWRSSARSGRLVVKQKVAAASEGTLLVLDVDESAYPSLESFGEGFEEHRFEAAVEVAASLAAARSSDGQRIRVTTTARQQPAGGADAALSAVLDTLAVVEPLQPLDCGPESLAMMARRSGCSQLVVVTGTPGNELVTAVRRCGSLSPVVVRVGGVAERPLPGAMALDVRDGQALL